MKKISILSIIGLLLFSIHWYSGFSQQISNPLKIEYLNGNISYSKYLEYSVLNAYEPESVPIKFRIPPEKSPRSGTFLIQEVKTNWSQLTPATQQKLFKYLQRRQMPYHVLSPSKQFRIHYTTTDRDAVDPTDQNKNGVPDYVEQTGIHFDYIHQLLVDSLGYQPPAPDSSGNGTAFDVYLVNLSIWYGVTYLEQTVPGRENAWSCYMEIENDYAGFPNTAGNNLRVTSAHEYYHVVQVSYTYRDEDVFFMEMCSTWMEDFAHNDVNDYLNYLPTFFNRINYPFSYVNEYYEYASCLWNHMITKKYGHDIFRQIWERIPEEKALSAISNVLSNHSTSFNQELISFGLWNYFTGSRSDTLNFYPEGYSYPEVRYMYQYNANGSDISFDAAMSKLSSVFYKITNDAHQIDVGLIVTNLETPTVTPYGNFDPNDVATFSIDVVAIQPKHQFWNDDIFLMNQLVRVNDHHAIRLNVDQKNDWFARAVTFFVNGDYQVVQFYPMYPFGVHAQKNFIELIYPNPYIAGGGDPLKIKFVVAEEKTSELFIYSSDGRLVKTFPPASSKYDYHVAQWNGESDSGQRIASGVYIA
ncbi:MAG: DUF6055 domain-containing protein, partial [bacterium]|nr:DUF6055 domain-containing protein [bacterium]